MSPVLAESGWLESAWREAVAAAHGGPWTPVALAVLAAVGGLVFWGMGGGLVRPLVKLLTVAAAGFVGYALFPRLQLHETPQWLGALGGAVVGLMVSGLIFRLTTALLLAATLAIWTPALVCVSTNINLTESPARIALAAGEMGERRTLERRDATAARIVERVATEERDAIEPRDAWRRAGDVVGRAGHAAAGEIDAWREWWVALGERDRSALFLAALAAGAAGLAVGVLFPRMAATAATAALGSAAWLWAGTWLAFAMRAPQRERLPESPGAWLILWGVITLVGMLLQSRGGRHSRRKAPTTKAAAHATHTA